MSNTTLRSTAKETKTAVKEAASSRKEARPFWRTLWRRSFGRTGRLLYRRLLRPVLGLNDSPHSIALGLTMGLFIAMTPTVGIQMPIVFVATSLFGGNRIAGLAMTWISNPITTIPLYYGYFCLGNLIVGGESVGIEELRAIVDDKDANTWEVLEGLLTTLGWPLWLGSLIVATIVAPPFYPISKRYFERRSRKRKAKNS